jgi:hypothetical protein
MAWAFAAGYVVILLVVGAAALFLRGDDTPVAAPEGATADVGWQWSRDVEWKWIPIDEPWASSVVDVAPLAGGGFVVAATDEWSVLWSSDGIEWRDADPQRQVTVQRLVRFPSDRSHVQAVTAVGDRVAMLDSTLLGIKIGDLETGAWEAIEFDTSDLVGEVGVLAVAANETHVLVIGYLDAYGSAQKEACAEYDPDGTPHIMPGLPSTLPESRYLAWMVDPQSGHVQRHSYEAAHQDTPPAQWMASQWAGARLCGRTYASVAWFEDHWVLNLGEVWAVSPDGQAWTPLDFDEVAPVLVSLTPGANSLLAVSDWMGEALREELEGNPWAEVGPAVDWSDTGSEWTRITPPLLDAAYSESLGYVGTGDGPELYTSEDGRTWHATRCIGPEVGDLVASGDRVLGIGSGGLNVRPYLFVHGDS